MTDIIARNKHNRFIVLDALYNKVEGSPFKRADLLPLGIERMSKEDFAKVHSYLLTEKLIAPYGSGYTCYITTVGIKEVELVHSKRADLSVHFASLPEMGL
jgi:hypothetical protein